MFDDEDQNDVSFGGSGDGGGIFGFFHRITQKRKSSYRKNKRDRSGTNFPKPYSAIVSSYLI
jgi:hypothetical protein